MTKYYVIDKEIITRHVGLIELDNFYTWLKRWFEFELDWKDTNEEYYRETIIGEGLKNIEMLWTVKKKISSYFSYVVHVKFLLIAVSDAEIQVEGRRRKAQKGDFEVKLMSYVETDPKKVGERGSMFRKVLEKLILKKGIERHKLLLFQKITKLNDEMKEIFKQYEVV